MSVNVRFVGNLSTIQLKYHVVGTSVACLVQMVGLQIMTHALYAELKLVTTSKSKSAKDAGIVWNDIVYSKT